MEHPIASGYPTATRPTNGPLGATSGLTPVAASAYTFCMKNNLFLHRPLRTQAGFSLVEVLISVIILSFGLLGMVGLQAAALQSNREARLQSTATAQATELAEMMRGNKDVGLLTTGNPYLGNFTTPLTPNTANYCLNVALSTTPCASTATIADAQMTEWLSRVDAELPGARVVICMDAAPYDASGLPRWNCATPVSGGSAPAVIKIGWTQGSTNRAATGSDAVKRASDPQSKPIIVLAITAGAPS